MKSDKAIDAAIERLAEIKDKLRPLQAEELELKEMIKHWAGEQGVDYSLSPKYHTPDGKSATFYTRTTESFDIEYLEKVLTKRQLNRARIERVSNCLRIT